MVDSRGWLYIDDVVDIRSDVLVQEDADKKRGILLPS